MSTVLLVEDDPEIVALLADFLAVEGFGVVSAADAGGAIDALGTPPDRLRPARRHAARGSGFDVCRRIRERSDVPLLFLSARGEDEDKLRGLALGADDYIVKSATPAEVVARVKAVLRRTTPRSGAPARVRALRVDLDAHEVTADGRQVALTAREFELLRAVHGTPAPCVLARAAVRAPLGLLGRPQRRRGLRAAAAREARARS